MTREDIIRMAQEAGAKPSSNPEKWDIFEISDTSLERFADLVAAHEREVISSQRKQLNKMTVLDLADQHLYEGGKVYGILEFARAIEYKHGIKL